MHYNVCCKKETAFFFSFTFIDRQNNIPLIKIFVTSFLCHDVFQVKNIPSLNKLIKEKK
jgi:hypothetical protein